jgi:hypothetical protein
MVVWSIAIDLFCCLVVSLSSIFLEGLVFEELHLHFRIHFIIVYCRWNFVSHSLFMDTSFMLLFGYLAFISQLGPSMVDGQSTLWLFLR